MHEQNTVSMGKPPWVSFCSVANTGLASFKSSELTCRCFTRMPRHSGASGVDPAAHSGQRSFENARFLRPNAFCKFLQTRWLGAANSLKGLENSLRAARIFAKQTECSSGRGIGLVPVWSRVRIPVCAESQTTAVLCFVFVFFFFLFVAPT